MLKSSQSDLELNVPIQLCVESGRFHHYEHL